MTDTPDDKFNIESLADPYRAEIARLRGLLVKACVEVADGLYFEERFCPYTSDHEACIKYVADEYGIRLRWNGETFEEDTTK